MPNGSTRKVFSPHLATNQAKAQDTGNCDSSCNSHIYPFMHSYNSYIPVLIEATVVSQGFHYFVSSAFFGDDREQERALFIMRSIFNQQLTRAGFDLYSKLGTGFTPMITEHIRGKVGLAQPDQVHKGDAAKVKREQKEIAAHSQCRMPAQIGFL